MSSLRQNAEGKKIKSASPTLRFKKGAYCYIIVFLKYMVMLLIYNKLNNIEFFKIFNTF